MKLNINKVFTNRISTKFETSVITPSGEKRFFHSIAAPLKKDGKIVAALCIAIDTTKIKNIESDLKLKLNYIKKILDSASEIIFTINKNKKLTIWNKSAEKKIGYQSKNILNKKIKNIKIFENPKLIEDYIEDKINRKKSYLQEIMINTKKGNKILLAVSTSEIKNESNEISDILFVCWDVTHENISESIMLGKSYILFENKLDKSLKIFNQNIKKFKKGIIVTRNIKNLYYQYKNEKNIELLELSSKQNKKIINISNIEELKKLINLNFNKNNNILILIDRIDYFLSRSSFTNLIQNLYEINDNLKNVNSTIIIRFNPSLIKSNQRIQLEQEFNKIPLRIIEEIKIKDEIYDILKYINKKNENNVLITNIDLEKQFNISKKSLANKLDTMLEKGLIYYTKKDKIKIINISNTAMKYL
jgi:PAS domain S-box-containing protein